MSPKPIFLSACLLFLGMALAAPCWTAPQEVRNNTEPELGHRLDAMEQTVATRLDAQEKLVQAKVDQVSAISQSLENGRKDVDWWLSSLAVFLGLAGVLAVAIPVILQKRQNQAFEAEVRNIRDTFARLQDFEKQMRADTREGLDTLRAAEREVREHLKTAEQAASKTVALSKEAEQAKRTLVQDKPPEELRKAAEELGKVQDSPIAKLSAKALELAQAGQWEQAVARWRALTDLDPIAESHWFNLGYALQDLSNNSKTERIFYAMQASQAYSEAVRVKPDMHAAWNNWGNALADWALALPEAERPTKFAEAGEKYAEALRLKPDMHYAWNNWGIVLVDWALALPEAERPAKFAEAGEKYAEAVRLKPGMHEAWNNWGNALANWARVLPEAERPAKFAEAGEKYAEAVRLKPEIHEAWNNWGNTLLRWWRIAPEADRPGLLMRAREVLLKTETWKAGTGAYNLACVAALAGHSEEAQDWLEKARAAGDGAASDCQHLRTDPDLDSLRKLPWFIAFVDEACRNQAS